MSSTRREFLKMGWKLGGTMLGVAAGWTTYESLRPLATETTGGIVTLGNPSRYKPGTATYIVEGRLWVANAGGRLFALSQKCPHLGCRVPFCESSGRFECPCHGSKYDLAGEWIQGPAPRGLDRYKLSLDGANLVVDTSTLLQGPERGQHKFLTPATGASCIPKA